MLKVEDKPVGPDPLLAEAIALLPTLKIGQSFVVPVSVASRVRQRAGALPGKFATRTEDDGSLRIGRTA